MEDGKSVAARRKALGMNQDDLARRAGVHRNTVVKIESGRQVSSGNLQSVIFALERAEGMVSDLPPDDLAHLELWRALPRDMQSHITAILGGLTAHASEPASAEAGTNAAVVELDARRLMRLVGYVAAKEETAEVDFDTRLGDEVEVPAHEYLEDACLVFVRGSSMADAGYEDGDMLVVQRATLGQYQRGDIVVAMTPEGQVVKRYAGQRRGVIRLESVGQGKTIEAPASSIVVQGIVRRRVTSRA